MNFLEKYIDNPFKDENLNEEEIHEYEKLRDMYYYLMAHGDINDTFTSWIKKNKNNIEEIKKQIHKKHNNFNSYLRKAHEQ